MKTLTMATMALAAFCVTAAETKTLTPEQIKASREKRRQVARARAAKEGGYVRLPSRGNFIRLVNVGKAVDNAILEETAASIFGVLQIKCVVTDMEKGECAYGIGKEALKLESTGAAIVVTDSDKGPTLMVAPEDFVGAVNVRKLKSDSPDAKVFATRVQKEVWRAFAMTLGASNSQMQPCLMSTMKTLGDLDRAPDVKPSPEPYNKIIMTSRRIGVIRPWTGTYRQAVELGVAPEPTNEVQKVIWESVKAERAKGPEKAIKIKYDPKTGR